MEVHHTTIDVHGHRGRKKWTHYLWEFLMLFLAVFCGFLAENQREHFVERSRAKEYARSLLADLRQDTAELNAGIKSTVLYVQAIDSLLAYQLMPGTQTVSGKFYYYNAVMAESYRIDWNRSTIDQLLQSGSLRYFSAPLMDSISNYYALGIALSSSNNIDIGHRERIIATISRIFENRYIKLFIADKPTGNILDISGSVDSLLSKQLAIQPGSGNSIDELLNLVSFRKEKLIVLATLLYPRAATTAGYIIDMLKKNYHLE